MTSFERHTIRSRSFFDYLEEQWPATQRPKKAGVGTIAYQQLSRDSFQLKGALFIVTTRNQSDERSDYGYYKNTSITGYAVVKNNLGQNEQEFFEKAVLLLTVNKLVDALGDPASKLRRSAIVMYTDNIRGTREDRFHDAVLTFLNGDADARKKALKDLIESLPKPNAQGKAAGN